MRSGRKGVLLMAGYSHRSFAGEEHSFQMLFEGNKRSCIQRADRDALFPAAEVFQFHRVSPIRFVEDIEPRNLVQLKRFQKRVDYSALFFTIPW